MRHASQSATLLIPRTVATSLLRLYDYPDPRQPGQVIRGYDRPHALRTAKMCAAVAMRLNHPRSRVEAFQVACLLHDLGRAGLDRRLFGKIWSWAKERKIPTRPREWRARYPKTPYGRETEAFWTRYRGELEKAGMQADAWAKEQIEMRLGYARRLARRLRQVKPELQALNIAWFPWMGKVMLYYYYPEKFRNEPRWVKQLGEILVACEQFEAFSNRRRGRDYYVRSRESFVEAFSYLDTLHREGILSEPVLNMVRTLSGEGTFDRVLIEARGRPLTSRDLRMLRGFATGVTVCP